MANFMFKEGERTSPKIGGTDTKIYLRVLRERIYLTIQVFVIDAKTGNLSDDFRELNTNYYPPEKVVEIFKQDFKENNWRDGEKFKAHIERIIEDNRQRTATRKKEGDK